MKTVMVVEDEYDLMATLRTILEGEGYATLACRDGKDALERLRSAPPDLVLMDVMLPHLSGLQVARIMRETPELAGVPVVLMSAIPPARKPDAGRSGPFLQKPFSLSTLLETIEGLIGRPGANLADP